MGFDPSGRRSILVASSATEIDRWEGMVDDGDSQRVRPLVLVLALIALFVAASLGTAALGDQSEASNFCKTYGLLPDDPVDVDVDGRLVHLGWQADERGQCGNALGH